MHVRLLAARGPVRHPLAVKKLGTRCSIYKQPGDSQRKGPMRLKTQPDELACDTPCKARGLMRGAGGQIDT